jgi:hypothetical protein
MSKIIILSVLQMIAADVPGLTQSGLGTSRAGEIGYLTFSANLRQPLN